MGDVFIQLIPFALIFIGFVTGKVIELRHLRRLALREAELRDVGICNLRKIPAKLGERESFLVTGSAVIATDYFKVFAAGLRGLFGGEMKTYRSLMSRARREAVVRMLEQARQLGAGSVWNVRLETSTIQGKRRPGGVEVFVYGTAVKM